MQTSRNSVVRALFLHLGCLCFGLTRGHSSTQGDLAVVPAVEERVCSGTKNGFSYSQNITVHLQRMKDRYTNCTHVQGNLELTNIPSEADVDFLQNIREVTGYLLIYLITKPQLNLRNLRIVRGRRLFGVNEQNRFYSVFITINRELKQLGLEQLREISTGGVYMSDNPRLCHATNTVNWNDLLDKISTHLELGSGPNATYAPGCLPCHNDCIAGYCWGPGRDQCQNLTKTICAKQCGLSRCRGPSPSDCCHPECAGGCTGPGANECSACRHFTDDGHCVEMCPALQKYDPDQFTNVPNPDGKFAYGTLCLKECPPNFLRHEQYCVSKCPPGKQEQDGICVACDGPCPKICAGFEQHPPAGRINWITNITLQQFQNCTVIEGSLIILRQSFSESAEFVGDKAFFHPGISHSQLEQLSTINKITGYLRIDAQHANMTNLSFLRSLETIEGRFLEDGHAALTIVKNQHLRSLGLNSLKSIKAGRVRIVGNPKLCYADKIAWNTLTPQSSVITATGVSLEPLVRNNRDNEECVRDGETCNAECTIDGCWGPQPNQCLFCANYMYKSVCLSDCAEWNVSNSAILYPAGNKTCAPCHVQCRDGCKGPGESNCTACLHAKDGPNCVAVCPVSKYSDSQRVCQPCDKLCVDGCSGPGSFVGEAGCMSCQAGIVNRGATNVTQCLPAEAPCPPRHFQTIAYNQTAAMATMIGKKICKPCHPYCTKCHNSGVYNCQECTHFKIPLTANFSKFEREMIKMDGECVLTCPNATHYTEEGSLCKRCSSACGTRGCTGPLSTQCESCRSFRDYYDPDRPQLFNCTNRCPAERFYSTNQPVDPQIVLDPSESICSKDDVAVVNNTKYIILGVVGAVVGIVVVVGIVLCFRIRKSKIQLETLIIQDKFAAIEETEPLAPTDNKPDTSKLRLISEKELRRGEELGQGAFGVVYKGFWMPPNENLKIPVAIKVLKEGVGSCATKEILDEAHVMASVNNPHLVSLLALCMTSQIMLITQLLPLGSLLDYVKKNKKSITSRSLLNWSSQIAKGMKYLEQRHMIHRDLAARNVLVERPNWVKVTDFGLARIMDCDEGSVKSTGGLMPIKWLAPECIDRSVYSHKTDVWAFGVTVWELLSYGLKPFEDIPVRELYSVLQSGERLPQPSICTLDVYMLLLKCWSSHPESRPSFVDLADDFAKMTRDPGRYLVIPGDEYMRLPDYTVEDQQRIFRDIEDTGSEKLVMADDYVEEPAARGPRSDPQRPHSGLPALRYTPSPVARTGKHTDNIAHLMPNPRRIYSNNGYLIPTEGSAETAYLDLGQPLTDEAAILTDECDTPQLNDDHDDDALGSRVEGIPLKDFRHIRN